MLFCCHRYFGETNKRYLTDTVSKINQFLEYGECPICKSKRIWYKYTNILASKEKEITLKGKKAESLLKDLLRQPYFDIKELKEKHGTKNNMFWLYQSNGQIKDFNNTLKGNCQTDIKVILDNALGMSAFL